MLSTGRKLLLVVCACLATFGVVAVIEVARGAMTVEGVCCELLAAAVLAILLATYVFWKVLGPLAEVARQMRDIQRARCKTEPAGGGDDVPALRHCLAALSAAWEEHDQAHAARLARATQSLKLALNTLPHAIAIVSDDGRIEVANETAERLLGLNTGQHVDELHMGWLSDLFAAATGPHGDGRLPIPLQVFDHGVERFFLPRGVAIRGQDGRLLGVTVVLADATQSRQVDEAKSGLISTVSHELKTPLTSIKMSLGLLLEDNFGPLNAQQKELLEAAAQDADRLHHMIQNLLDTARGRAAHQALTLAHMADVAPERAMG